MDDQDKTCQMCHEELLASDDVRTLMCMHVFHLECFHNYEEAVKMPYNAGELKCPTCRNTKSDCVVAQHSMECEAAVLAPAEIEVTDEGLETRPNLAINLKLKLVACQRPSSKNALYGMELHSVNSTQ